MALLYVQICGGDVATVMVSVKLFPVKDTYQLLWVRGDIIATRLIFVYKNSALEKQREGKRKSSRKSLNYAEIDRFKAPSGHIYTAIIQRSEILFYVTKYITFELTCL